MSTTKVSPRVSGTSEHARRFSVLDVVILVGLLAAAVDYLVPQLLAGHIIPPPLIMAVAYLVAAVVVAARWRWAMIIPLIVGLVSLVIHLSPGFPLYAMTHPSEYASFAPIILQLPLLLMVVGACVAKLVQTVRHEPPHAPRWLTPGIATLAGFALGALLIGAVAQPPTAGGTASAQERTETVHLAVATFVPDIIALHAGDKLVIVDDVPLPHTLSNGTWSHSNRPMPGVEPGAVILHDLQLNNNTVTVGPFATPGTYHIYCTVHPGMNLTIIVQ